MNNRMESAWLENKNRIVIFCQVEEGQHVQVIVESRGHIFSNHTLPLSFSSSEISFVVLQVFN